MKKLRIAALALLAPVAFVAGCGAADSGLALSANWYRDTSISTSITGTSETLVYAVTFEPRTPAEDYAVSYDGTTYTVTLSDVEYVSGGNKLQVYLLRSEMNVTGRYSYAGAAGEDFSDTVRSEVYFLDVSEGLRPLKSTKEVVVHAPVNNPSAERTFALYDYVYTVEYDDALETATVTYDAHAEEDDPEPVVTTLNIGGSGSYFDNEELLFALRGLEMTTTFNFRTVNPVTQTIATAGSLDVPAVSSTPLSLNLKVNGEQREASIDYVTVSVGYAGVNRGETQKLDYARKTSANDNAYRNALIRMSVPTLNQLGTFTYVLSEMTINEK